MKKDQGQLQPRVLRIVIVEDNLDSVHSTTFLLRELGHTVEYAVNGYVALDVVRRFRPELVILDLGLPGINGFDVCRQIKADPELRPVKVVALTAYDPREFNEKASAVGFDRYYQKPLPPGGITALLAELGF